MNRREYMNIFTFFDENNKMIEITEMRECTDILSMISYCFEWLKKFGDKYGIIERLEIYEITKDVSFLVYDVNFSE